MICPYCKKQLTEYQCYRGQHVWDCDCGAAPFAAKCDCGNSEAIELARRIRLCKEYDALLDVDRTMTFEAFKASLQPKNYAKAKKMAASWHKGAYMHGNPGTGKTHLATAILLDAVKARKTAAFVKGIQLSKLFADSLGYSDNKKSAESEIERLRRADVLCIDDIDDLRKSSHDTFREQFSPFISGLAGRLIVTTNKTTGEMLSILGEKGQSRLLGRCENYVFSGKDMRRK